MYQATGNQVILVSASGERVLAAVCDDAGRAAGILNKASEFNGRRRYTAAARAMYNASLLPGFKWQGAFADVVTK